MTFSSKAQKFTVNYFAFTHLLIAAGAGVSAYFTGVALGMAEEFMGPALFIGLCTGLGYNVQRLLKVKISPESIPVERLSFLRENGVWMLAVWGMGVMVGACCLDLEWELAGLGGVVGLGLLGVAYAAVPKNWVKGLRALREVPGLKLPLLSVVWGAAVVVLPWMLSGAAAPSNVLWWILAARILYIAGLTVPFDYRDADLDHPSMKTLAQTLGPHSSLILATLLVLISGAIWMYVGMNLLAIHSLFTALLVSPILCNKNRGEFYFSVILDGMLVVQLWALS